MRQLTKAEYRLLEQLASGNRFTMNSLRGPTKAVLRRMRIKGFLHKASLNRGPVRATKYGVKHLEAHKQQTPGA